MEKILKEAPWTFNKVNPLKEACREFLREVDAADGAREHHAVGSEPTPETGSVGEQQSDDDERKKKGRTRKLTLLATKALVAACDSGRPALAEPALGAAHKLVAMGFLAGTTGSRARTPTDSEAKKETTAATENKETTSTTDANKNDDDDEDDVAAFDAACVASVRSFCACASFFPSSVNASGTVGNTTHVAAVGALLACAVSETFRLEGEALVETLSALLRVAVAAAQPETRAAAKAATTQLINAAFRRARFDGRDNDAVSSTVSYSARESDSSEKNALLVLLTLCERASAPESGESQARETEKARRGRNAESVTPSDPFAAMATALVGGQSISALVASETRNARTRAVSLDLLRQLLEGPGSAAWLTRLAPRLRKPLRAALAAGVETEGSFASSEHHTANVTGALSASSRASARAVARADPATLATASLARAAFTSLVLRARHAYKPEIARLYPRMALAPLEGGGGSSGVLGSSNAKAKLAALRVIRALASDPQVLVDVFVNHDCDARGDNLYERTIGALASTMAPGGGDQQRFRDGAVQCVLAVVRSLRAWHARGADGATDDATVKGAATNDDVLVAATMAIPPGGARPVSRA